MNGNLKLVSWIIHLQPFFSQPHLLIKSKSSEKEVYCFSADVFSSLRIWSWCCYHLETLHIQEGKNTNVEPPKLISLMFVKLYQTLEKYYCVFEKNNVLYFPHQGNV